MTTPPGGPQQPDRPDGGFDAPQPSYGGQSSLGEQPLYGRQQPGPDQPYGEAPQQYGNQPYGGLGQPYGGPNQPYAVPDPAMTERQRRWLPIAVVVAILAIAAVIVIIVTSTSGSADASDYGLDEASQDGAPDVSQVAADAAAAADDVDIEAGLALMCQVPSPVEVSELKAVIAAADQKAGGEAKKSITITHVEQGADSGKATIAVEGEGALSEYSFTATATVAKVGDSWCIKEISVD